MTPPLATTLPGGWLRSICPYCGTGCGLRIRAHNGVVTQVEGDPDHPVNQGKLCAKGALLAPTLVTEDRLLFPQLRDRATGNTRRVSWDAAMDRVATAINKAIRDHGPDSIMLYAFPSSWTLNGVSTHANDVLSTLDREFVAGAKMYPKSQPGLPAATTLTIGPGRVEANIGKPGEEDLFRFKVADPGAYVIDTVGPTDVYLKLFGPNNPTALIDEDDDSGLGLNPRIATQLMPGEYFAQVRHYDRTSGTGRYSIGVRKR